MMGLKTIYEYDDEIKKIDEILHSFNELKKERDKLEDYTHKRNRMIEKCVKLY